ncbi:MAG: bacterial Ig-like domain-containing protein [Eubacteriales bacterium]|nr:bacterial Ig-like domain-containing protein [Eubacteriales bacterium]
MQAQKNFKQHLKSIAALSLTLLMIMSVFPQNIHAVKVRENEEYLAGKTLRPISEMFHLDRILEWEKWSSPDDDLNRASVPLRPRFTGHVVNPLASDKAKIQSVPLMNSKNDEDNSVNGDDFDVFAFDFWQYVDQMVFWDGPIPTADVIDAGHRNGVPVYGTLFFNWSTSAEDRRVVEKFLTSKMVNGKKVFPVADKLIDMVEFYGFDGYFINQETSMYSGWGAVMRDFMLYAQRRAKERKTRVRFSWYDAMSNSGPRVHYDAVTSGNDFFMKRYGDDKQYASDEFFINFNWMGKTTGTVNHMQSIDRDPFDAYAGFELQQRSYNTSIGYPDLLGPDKKLRVSIGLYTPDSIRGMALTPEDYHEQERNFWVGFDGDPTTSADTNSKGKWWRGMARFVADKSAIMEMPFNTYFNTGHGRKWFIDGALSKNEEWNSRGVQEILPTWRWWIRSSDDSPLTAKYDFTDAYNSGNSLLFTGNSSAGETNKIMLYSTRLDASADTKLKVAYKGGEGATAYIDLGTAEDYSENGFTAFELPKAENGEWKVAELPVAALSGQKIHSIRLRLVGSEEKSDFSFNLGQLALYNDSGKPEMVTDGQVDEVIFRSSSNAEARLSWTPVADAEYYEVYQQNSNGTKSIINATSSKYFYAEKITRDAQMSGTTQELYVVSVGKNGVKSEPAVITLDWQMLVNDTEDLPEKAINVCLGAEVTDVSAQNDSEPARNAINGTISGNTDKWCAAGYNRGHMSIKLTEEKTVRRVAVYHAQAGSEGAAMNTRDFTIQYKDKNGEWQIAHTIRNNSKAVTDFPLATPITAREWKLDITRGDTSPWTAIRIYEWQMFETLKDNRADYIPMRWVTATNTENNQYDITFKNVEKDYTVKLYKDDELQNLIQEKTATTKGDLTFSGVELEIPEGQKYGKIYYVTQTPNSLPSIRMTMVYHKKTATVESVKLTETPNKSVYAKGEPLNVTGGKIEVSYSDGETKQMRLTPSMVKGFNSNALTVQELEVYFGGKKADRTFQITVKNQEDLEISEIKVKNPPKNKYLLQEELDLSGATIEVVLENLSTYEVSMQDSEVSVTGFDSDQVGEKQLTITYKAKTTNYTVSVSDKELVNKEKLQETIAQAKHLTEEEIFAKADQEVQDALKVEIVKAEEVEKNDDADGDAVAAAVAELSEAIENYKKNAISNVKIKQEPSKVEYQFGEAFNPEGGLLTVTYRNERQEEVAMTADMVAFNPEQAGTQDLTVTYKGFEAGTIEVTVAEKVNELMQQLKAELNRAKEARESEAFNSASDVAKEGLENIIRIAEGLVQTGAEDEVLERVIGELKQAILDLTRTVAPLLPYIPETSKDEEEVVTQPSKPKEEEIKDEEIALSSAEKALVEEMAKAIQSVEDKKLIEQLVGKQVTAKEFVNKISDKALEEYAGNVGETFKDEASSKWYAKELSAIRMLNLVKGYDDQTFGAEKEVTGEQFVTFLVRALEIPVEEQSGYDWFAPYKAVAEKTALLKGITFDLKKALTREEVAALAYAFKTQQLAEAPKAKAEAQFTDRAKVSANYADAVNYLNETEILKGYEDGSFMPEKSVKRSEVVAILYRLLKK